MTITLAEPWMAPRITGMLNIYLSFGLAKESAVLSRIEKKQFYVYLSGEATKESSAILGVCSLYPYENNYFIPDRGIEHALEAAGVDLRKSFILGHLAVDLRYRGNGIGTSLLRETMSTLNTGETALALGWIKPKIGWQAKGILKELGFNFLQIEEKYWLKDSAVEQYGCPHCSDYYCECDAQVGYLTIR